MTTTPPSASDAFGTNSWLVDEMYQQYRIDPTSVADTWREFFSDYTPGHAGSVPGVAASAPAPVTNGTSSVAASNGSTTGAPKAAAVPAGVAGEPIRG
ncbi:MAG: 2-oxoglutarate dehydrogenase E1 subunit family protein, partial [Actinomycetota bacterium]